MPTVRDVREKAGEQPITMLTAYDATTAELAEQAGVDVLLVGDSLGNVVLGHDTTLPVTVEEMHSHTAAVVRGTDDALVVADMPFLSVGVDESESIEHCGRMLKEAGANAVKIESGPHTVELTERLTDLGIPVMAHLGLTPQHVNRLGYTRQGTTQQAADEIRELARAHEDAGAFTLVLEHVPANLARTVTEDLSIPTIGIGAGPECDGQVLVVDDAVGLSESTPPFAEAFGDVRSAYADAIESYVEAVEDDSFPAREHTHDESTLDLD
ncbi:3-methyl-2-oxobutanoate hydroxymethyltransferase [Halorhabdus sp. CBA1104]|uniref:3-methyl-2-oxobutanoate hydroxymethyltransferase n=1 Tax=unclassified Halorhabdus TaxID=2621901 RepID=UPI0012B37590|nr:MULTISPECIES: 3-methyl-2-oxobutanoate hydroxymethyltransferase [unclassified Halorhabdus]QGN07651.1 3-methyl-2-oxobutanoate hydroxymethyltransferase [Halorhabdus sp. CBA1104]